MTDFLIQFGPLGVFLLGLIDSMGVPLPATLDALVLFLAIKAPERAYWIALSAVAGSVVGNLVLFYAAAYGRRLFSKGDPPPGKRQKFEAWFRRYGMLTIFVPAVVPVVPLPLKVFVVFAGVFHTPLGKFLAVILSARVIRYFGEAWLGIHLGAGATDFLHQNVWALTLGAVVLVLLLYGAVRSWPNRGSVPGDGAS